jgi:hypothetical protein
LPACLALWRERHSFTSCWNNGVARGRSAAGGADGREWQSRRTVGWERPIEEAPPHMGTSRLL